MAMQVIKDGHADVHFSAGACAFWMGPRKNAAVAVALNAKTDGYTPTRGKDGDSYFS